MKLSETSERRLKIILETDEANAALDELVVKLEKIQEKADRLKATLKECSVPADHG